MNKYSNGQIIDVSGKVVQQFIIAVNDEKININKLAPAFIIKTYFKRRRANDSIYKAVVIVNNQP